jgi:hypothetical protein
MNERLRELVRQAEKFAEVFCESIGDKGLWNDAFNEKFAELIVRECAQVCRNQPNTFAMKLDRDNCAIAIEEHFGVEE